MANSNLGIERLVGRENWSTWKFAVQTYLEIEDLWEAIEPMKKEDGSLEAVDPVKDKKARGKIILFLEPANFYHVRDAKTAREAWTKLNNAFEEGGLTREVGLLYKLIRTDLESCGTMEAYANRMISTCHQLNEIGFTIPERFVGVLLLAGLPERYQPMVMALKNSGTAITGDSIKTILLQEELLPSEKTAFVAKGKFKPKMEVAQGNGKSKKNSAQSKGPQCRKCSKFGHIAKFCPENLGSGSKKADVFCTVLSTIQGQEKNQWYLDSGATRHMTWDLELLEDVCSGNGVVVAANKETMRIEACGTATLHPACQEIGTEIPVHDVQFVPDLSTNLLSVVQIVKKGFKIVFESSGCEIYNPQGKLVATGVIENDLFKLAQLEEAGPRAGRAMLSSASASVETWHKRMGHLNYNSVKKLANGVASGIQISSENRSNCTVCPMGKQTRIPFSKSGSRAEDLLEVIHSDIAGPMEVSSPSGSRYYVTFIDDRSRKIFVYFLKKKSEEEVLGRFKEFQAQAERQCERKIKILRTDNGKEYTNNGFQNFLKQMGIRHQTTNDYTPEQNGLAERANRTITERARCMLFEANLPKSFWAEATAAAVYLVNRSPTRGHDLTPEEVWSGRKPDISHVRVFGTKAMVQVPKQKRQKWDSKSRPCILTGFEEETKGYRLYDPKTKCFLKSREVCFIDECIGEKGLPANQQRTVVPVDFGSVPSMAVPTDQEFDEAAYETAEEISEDEDDNDTSTDSDDVTVLPPRKFSNPPRSQVLRRSGREHVLPGKYKDFHVQSKGLPVNPNPQVRSDEPRDVEDSSDEDDGPHQCLALDSNHGSAASDEPKSYRDAMASPYAENWKQAMTEELESIHANRTWTLADLPPGRKAVGCKWVYKLKRDINGEVVRFKARLVAQGFSQQYGSDYDEVFAPVVQQTTFRTLMAVAAKKKMAVKQYDVKTAFLNGDLEEEIFMRQPSGFVQQGNERKVCRLNRSLYGLKQAARAWNQRLHEELKRQQFQRCTSDPCLYRKQRNGRWCYVLVYVDDLVIASEDPKMIPALVGSLKRSFEISELGDIRYYLGMEIEKDHHGDYFLSQQKYIREVVESSGLTDAKIAKTPLDPGYFKSENEGTPLASNTEYQKLIGKVLYIAVNTRPDISTAVSILSRKTNHPTQEDWNELKRVVRYLKGTINYRLRLSKKGETGTIIGYSDADWAENRDDRKSHSGFAFKVNGGTVSWACRKQTCVALSTAEAEFIALAETAQEALWLKLLLQELNDEQQVVIHEDNQSCLKIMEKEKLTRKMKHIATKFHFTRDLIQKQEMKCVYCPSEDMVADLMTKPLQRIRLEKLAKLIGLTVTV